MSTEILEEVLISSGEGEVSLHAPQQKICMPLQVYAIEVDIRETMDDLLARAGEALTLDLTHHKVTVLGDKQMDSQDTLQDQCGTRAGHVQVQFVIRSGEEGGVLDIVDVLKTSEEEADQEEVVKEDAPLPASMPERSRPMRWVVSSEFRGIQKALKMPRDPKQWTAAHVRVWLAWARQHFPEVAPHHHHHCNLDGAQMMTLTQSQLQQRRILLPQAGGGSSTSLFLTHRDLLKQTGAAAVCEPPPLPLQSVNQEVHHVTSRSAKVQKSATLTSGTSTTAVIASVPQPIQLWQFLLELLTEPKLVKVISWWGSGLSGEFRLHQPEVVAALWGHRKGRPNMTYDKLSRALRYYYEGDMIAKVTGKRFVYRFVLDLKAVVGYSAAELKAQVEQCVQNG